MSELKAMVIGGHYKCAYCGKIHMDEIESCEPKDVEIYKLKQALAKCRAFIKHLEDECNCTDDYADAIYEWKKAEAEEKS